MLAGLLILPFCGDPSLYLRQVIDHSRTVFVVSFFQTTLLYILFYPGLDMLPAAIGAIITGSQPLIIALIAHFVARSERMTVRRLFSILLGLAGVVIISLNRGEVTLRGGIFDLVQASETGGGACLSWIIIPGALPEVSAVTGMLCIAVALLILHVGKKAPEEDSIQT